MGRDYPNWFAMGCSCIYLFSFLFLPLYSILETGLNGMRLIFTVPILILPVIFGVVMIFAALLISPKISMILGGVTGVMTLVFSLLGNTLLSDVSPASSRSVEDAILSFSAGSLPVAMGFGMVLCMVMCVAYCVLELLLGTRRARKIAPTDGFSNISSGPIDF